jgi:histidinol-phosphatase
MNGAQLRELLDFAVDAAWRAGKVTLEYFQTQPLIERKLDHSVVTIADRRTEETIRQLIRSRYPTHDIVGEEYGSEITSSDYTWFLDPIDGTQSFVHGVPLYGVLIGLEYKKESVIGVVNCPAIGDIVYAARGEGCYWNGRRAQVSETVSLSQATVSTTAAELFQKAGRLEAWTRLTAQIAGYRTWGDCYGYVLVATGRVDAMIDPIMHVWDCAPMLPIITEAGGRFTDWTGTATISGGDAVASNGRLHASVLSALGTGNRS